MKSPTASDDQAFPAAGPLTRPWGIAIALIIAGALFVPLDVPLAKFCLADKMPGEVSRLLDRFEFFGHTYGVLGIAITVYLLDVARRRHLARLLSCALASGIAADVIKLLVHRVRPCRYDFQSGEPIFRGFSFASVESFSDIFETSYHSLPSAHTAVAVGLAVALGWLYPRGRGWFLLVAALTGASRVDGGAHFASDVCWGAALGYLVAHQCLGPKRWGRWFDHWESKHGPPLANDAPACGITAPPSRAA